MVDQSYFQAWQARMGDRELATTPVNLDRLGIYFRLAARSRFASATTALRL